MWAGMCCKCQGKLGWSFIHALEAYPRPLLSLGLGRRRTTITDTRPCILNRSWHSISLSTIAVELSRHTEPRSHLESRAAANPSGGMEGRVRRRCLAGDGVRARRTAQLWRRERIAPFAFCAGSRSGFVLVSSAQDCMDFWTERRYLRRKAMKTSVPVRQSLPYAISIFRAAFASKGKGPK